MHANRTHPRRSARLTTALKAAETTRFHPSPRLSIGGNSPCLIICNAIRVKTLGELVRGLAYAPLKGVIGTKSAGHHLFL